MKIKGLIKFTAVLLVFVVMLTACGQEKYEPQAINEETDICINCKMAVKDDQYATQIITKEKQSLKFDDIGCMNDWKKENGTDTIGAEFVRDYHSQIWINYEDAYYVYDASIKTPMAYGILSFEEESAAQAYIDEHGVGKLMTAEDLADHSWEVNRDMMQMPGHSHGADGEKTEMEHGHGDEADKH